MKEIIGVRAEVDSIAGLLQRLYEEGGKCNFLVLSLEGWQNYYVQFSGRAGDTDLYAEAVSNDYLAEPHKLGEAQVSLLQSLGWEHPGNCGNFSREWQVVTDEDRQKIAGGVLRVFTDVYGFALGYPLKAELVLE